MPKACAYQRPSRKEEKKVNPLEIFNAATDRPDCGPYHGVRLHSVVHQGDRLKRENRLSLLCVNVALALADRPPLGESTARVGLGVGPVEVMG